VVGHCRSTVVNVSAVGEELWPSGLHLIEQFLWTHVRKHYVQSDLDPYLLVVDELWLTPRSVERSAFLGTVRRKVFKCTGYAAVLAQASVPTLLDGSRVAALTL
jgi:hypothetical protein